MKKNLHLYQSPFRSESRILRETKTIVDSGFMDKVVIAAVWENGLHIREELDDKRSVYRMRCWMTCLPSTRISRMLILIEWAIRIPLKFFWQCPISYELLVTDIRVIELFVEFFFEIPKI